MTYLFYESTTDLLSVGCTYLLSVHEPNTNTEAEFMNIHMEEGKVFCQVFLFSPLQCTLTLL